MSQMVFKVTQRFVLYTFAHPASGDCVRSETELRMEGF